MKGSAEIYMALLVMIITIYLIRLIPFVLFRKEITNVYIRSFLYYVPFVTLAVMTFPAITGATSCTASGVVALVVGVIVALISQDLFTVAISACVAVFLCELFMI